MMRRAVFLTALVLGGAGFAQVPEDAMEEQRCVWRCLADSSGAGDPAYAACVAAHCTDAAPVAAQPATGDVPGRWSFNTHPVLGLTAHLAYADGAIGFACGAQYGPNVAFRASGVFAASPFIVYMLNGLPDGRSYGLRPVGAYSEDVGDACTTLIDEIRGAQRMTYIEGRAIAARSEESGVVTTIQAAAGAYEVRTGDDALGIPGARALPLDGAYEAIGAMLQSCPQIQADLSDYCGI